MVPRETIWILSWLSVLYILQFFPLHYCLDPQIPTALSLFCQTRIVYSGPAIRVCTPSVTPLGIRVAPSWVPTSPAPALTGFQQKGQLLPVAFSYAFSSSSGIHGPLILLWWYWSAEGILRGYLGQGKAENRCELVCSCHNMLPAMCVLCCFSS